MWVELEDQIADFDVLSFTKPLVPRQQRWSKVLQPASPKFGNSVLDTP